jgi:hypothetical protein
MNNKNKYISISYEKSVLLIFFFLYIIRLFSGRYLYSIAYQPMKAPELDYTFWFFLLTKIPQFLIGHPYFSLVIDISILLLIIYLFISNKFNLILKCLLLILFFIQHITVETYSCMHSKSGVLIFIALIPMFFKNEDEKLMIEFVRYFVIFILVSAAYHKIHNHAIFTLNHFQYVMYEQHVDLQVLNPNHLTYKIATILRSNVYYAYIAFMMLFVTQISFVVGIFTKKYDNKLIFLLIMFVFMTYLVMRIQIVDMLMAIPAFYFSNKIVTQLFFSKNTA